MLRLVFFLAVSCVLAWAAVWVVNHPGTVAVHWLDQELILNVGTVIANGNVIEGFLKNAAFNAMAGLGLPHVRP